MANLTALRDHNTAAVLGRIRAADEISRVELALATGLTAQAISKIVQRLAAEGLSNREIGSRLYLSHRTVGSHLYRAYPKLGITSRAQLHGALP